MEQYSLHIEPTGTTPFCQLDFTRGVLDFKGRSSPCASREFYHPIIENIENAFETGSDTLTANFRFEYFNTSSSKCLFDLLKRLAKHKSKGAEVTINWFYDEEDDDMKETGEDYEDLLGVNFNYIPM